MSTPGRPFDAESGDGMGFEIHRVLSPDDEALMDRISEHYVNNPKTILANPAHEFDKSIHDTARRLHEWCGYADGDKESSVSVYAALQFALFVGEFRNGSKGIQPDTSEFIARYKGNDEEAPRVIQEIAAEYFRKHRPDKGIVRAFIDELDPTDSYTDDLEIVFGFVMDMIERGNWLMNAREQLADITPSGDALTADEAALFEALENDLLVDASPVCERLVSLHEVFHAHTINLFKQKHGHQPDLNDENVVSVLGASMENWFSRQWSEIEDVPMPGDTIVVSGRGIVMVESQDVSGLVCLPFNGDMQQVQIRGTFKHPASQNYLDSAWLDLDPRQQEALGDSYIRTLGIHFVLEEAVLIHGATHQAIDKLYVPLHYPDTKIHLMRTAIPSDKE